MTEQGQAPSLDCRSIASSVGFASELGRDITIGGNLQTYEGIEDDLYGEIFSDTPTLGARHRRHNTQITSHALEVWLSQPPIY